MFEIKYNFLRFLIFFFFFLFFAFIKSTSKSGKFVSTWNSLWNASFLVRPCFVGNRQIKTSDDRYGCHSICQFCINVHPVITLAICLILNVNPPVPFGVVFFIFFLPICFLYPLSNFQFRLETGKAKLVLPARFIRCAFHNDGYSVL